MKITSAEFVASATQPENYPKKKLPEIAFVGRSNVGKSSLLNNLLTRKSLAKVSKTPGKTRMINYFIVNAKFYFVDLPGYGFAKVSPGEIKKWETMVGSYLTENPNLKQILILLDIRHRLQALDFQMLEWAEFHQQPYTIVLTKADQVQPGEVEPKRRGMHDDLKKRGIDVPLEKILPYSINSGKFKASLWTELNRHLR